MYKQRQFLIALPLILMLIIFATASPVAAQGDFDPGYCRDLDGKAFGLCDAYCNSMQCHAPDHDSSQNACNTKFDQFVDLTGSVPACEVCFGPTGATPCGNLATEPLFSSTGPLKLAVIHEQELDTGLLWAIHQVANNRNLGTVTKLSVADVAAGALRNTHYEVIILGRLYSFEVGQGMDRTPVPLALRDELDLALQNGSGVMTEWQGATAMFEDAGLLSTFQISPQWGWFPGALHGSMRFEAVFHNVAPNHPVMQGIPATFSNPDIDGCYLMWDDVDPSLEVLATLERADGGTLPAILTAQRGRGQIVMWLCDWSDDAALPPFGADDGMDLVVEGFLANGIEHASVPGCLAGTYGPSCEVPNSCAHLLALEPSTASGLYTLDPDGSGAGAELDAYCDMTTDGGGWTQLLDWDRASDPLIHTLASLQAVLVDEVAVAANPAVSPMSVLIERPTSIQWGDNDFTSDALSYRLDVVVPNGGELRLGVHYAGTSMEDSAVWFYATTSSIAGDVNENVLCYSTADATDGYSAAELALEPYACTQTGSDTFTFDGVEQRAFSAEISSVTLRSLHDDINLMDASDLFRLSVAVR